MISSVSLSQSGSIKVIESFVAIMFPRALKRSSILYTTTSSGNEFLIWRSSWSLTVFGSNNPWLLPTVNLPTMSEFATENLNTGILCGAKTESINEKYSTVYDGHKKAYLFVIIENTPISGEPKWSATYIFPNQYKK